MANVAVRSSDKASGASTASITVNAPAGTTTGDLVIATVASNTTDTISDGNGGTPFTKDVQVNQDSNASSLTIFSRRIVGGDPSTYTFTKAGATTRMSVVAVTFSSPDSITIYNPSAPSDSTDTTQSGTTSNVTKAITTTVNNSIHCIVSASDSSTVVVTAPTGDGYTEEQLTTNQPMSFCTKTITPAGDTGTHTFSYNFAAGNITQSFAIRNSAGFTITASGGGYNSTGLAATLRVGSYTYLRHRK